MCHNISPPRSQFWKSRSCSRWQTRVKGKKWVQDEPFVVKIPILSAKSGKDRLEGKAKNFTKNDDKA